jgi:polyphosphate kinase
MVEHLALFAAVRRGVSANQGKPTMSADKQGPVSELQKRVNTEIQDNLDEDIELELEDDQLADLLSETEHLETHDSLPRHLYFKELLRLQRELIKLQDWVIAKKLKLVVLFEGRDSAGKGGAIKRVMQRLNPRVVRTVALPAPTERERGQWYFQRYIQHLPTGGEIVLFDRSWYNRAGVERVMGFCTDEEYEEFFRSVPDFERLLVRSGIVLVKYWFSITDDEQHLRFLMRINDPLKQWKLSPMDLESRSRWEAYTKAKEIMLERSHIPEAPWCVVEAVDKKRARLNCIAHLLTRIPYQEVPHVKPVLPPRVHNPDYHRHPVPKEMYVPDHYANIAAEYAEHTQAQAGDAATSPAK